MFEVKITSLSLIPVKNRCGEAFTMSQKQKNAKFASCTIHMSVYKTENKQYVQLFVYIEICASSRIIKQTERGLYLRKSLAFYLLYMFM